jgi:hypothetical protein
VYERCTRLLSHLEEPSVTSRGYLSRLLSSLSPLLEGQSHVIWHLHFQPWYRQVLLTPATKNQHSFSLDFILLIFHLIHTSLTLSQQPLIALEPFRNMLDPPSLTSRMAGYNPFSKSKAKLQDVDNEQGWEVTSASIAGGGHSARKTGVTNYLKVSHCLRIFLVEQGALSEHDASLDDTEDLREPTQALQALLDKPHIDVPSSLTDRSHPLPEYFISSSHNTYLMAHQLFGTSSASAYETVLKAGSRCVEIDAWDNEEDKEEPKVTHG